MSVTFAAPATTRWTATSSAPSAAAAIVATRATTFMRTQAQWLRRGLEHADDRVALGIVLEAHDRSHDRWVAQIHAVEQALGAACAQDVASVYAYLGRVAGSLDSGAMQLLTIEFATHARQLLSERLTDLTEQTVDTLWQAAADV